MGTGLNTGVGGCSVKQRPILSVSKADEWKSASRGLLKLGGGVGAFGEMAAAAAAAARYAPGAYELRFLGWIAVG